MSITKAIGLYNKIALSEHQTATKWNTNHQIGMLLEEEKKRGKEEGNFIRTPVEVAEGGNICGRDIRRT